MNAGEICMMGSSAIDWQNVFVMKDFHTTMAKMVQRCWNFLTALLSLGSAGKLSPSALWNLIFRFPCAQTHLRGYCKCVERKLFYSGDMERAHPAFSSVEWSRLKCSRAIGTEWILRVMHSPAFCFFPLWFTSNAIGNCWIVNLEYFCIVNEAEKHCQNCICCSYVRSRLARIIGIANCVIYGSQREREFLSLWQLRAREN